MERFIVTELKGYPIGRSSYPNTEGLSCHVLDTAWNYRVMASYSTSDFFHIAQAVKRRRVRRLARAKCRALNRAVA